jgi:hypothetical protein
VSTTRVLTPASAILPVKILTLTCFFLASASPPCELGYISRDGRVRVNLGLNWLDNVLTLPLGFNTNASDAD